MSINLLLHDPFCVVKDYPEHYAGIINTYPFKAVVQKYNPTGDYLATGCKDGSIIIYDMDTNKLIMYLGKNALIDNENTDGFLQTHCLNKNHQDEILSLEWSPCGRYIISAAKDNEIKLWDLSCNHKNMVENTQLHFDKPGHECQCKTFRFEKNVHEARFMKNNQNLVVVTTQMSYLPYVIDINKNVYNSIDTYFGEITSESVNGGNLFAEIVSNEKKLGTSTSLLVTEKKLFVGTSKGWCFVYDIEDIAKFFVETYFKTSSSSIKNLLLNNSMDTLYVNSADRVIRQFDIISENIDGKSKLNINLKHKYQDVINRLQWNDIILSPHNGDFLVASANGANKDTGLFLWDTINGSLVKIYENSGEQLSKIDWDPNNMSIAASGYESGDIFCWEVSLPPKWASLAPDFEEVDEQVQYIEQEDEFDDQDNDYLKKDQNKFETDIKVLDLVTPDKIDVRGNIIKSHNVFKIPTNYNDIIRLRKNVEQ